MSPIGLLDWQQPVVLRVQGVLTRAPHGDHAQVTRNVDDSAAVPRAAIVGQQRLLRYHPRDLGSTAQPSPSVIDVVDLIKVGRVELVRRDQGRKDAL